MPIDWETQKELKREGHPKRCVVKANRSTKKDGTCKATHMCMSAGTPDCVAVR
jgi:hypothetical protein